MSISVAFGQVLRSQRLKAGLSQEALGLEAGLQRNYISSLELGHKQPTIGSVFKLATALGVKPAKLIDAVDALLKDHL